MNPTCMNSQVYFDTTTLKKIVYGLQSILDIQGIISFVTM